MQISVLNVTISTQPTKTGKTYQMADVAYKNLTFGGKVEGKKLASFGAQADTFKELANAQSGQVFEIEVVKNPSGFNDWVSAKPSQASSGSINNQAAVAPRSNTGAAQSPRSTYETPEERAQRQVYIIRQSSFSNAVSALSVGSKVPVSFDNAVAYAKRIEDYVFGKKDAGASGFDDFEDVPFDTEVSVE